MTTSARKKFIASKETEDLKAGDLRGKLRCFACIFQFPPEKKVPDGAGSSTSGME